MALFANADSRCAGALAAFALVCFCTFSAAAQPIDGEKFRKYLNSEAHKALVGKTYASVPKAIFGSCRNIGSGGSRSIPLTPISFGPEGTPATGSWKQEFQIDACGSKIVLNFFFIAADGKVNGIAGAPGDTHGSLLLQRDTVVYAHMGASTKAKDCKQFDIANTRFEGFGTPDVADPGASARFRPWWETWTLVGCGHTLDVPIVYQPDATGTLITQSANKVIER